MIPAATRAATAWGWILLATLIISAGGGIYAFVRGAVLTDLEKDALRSRIQHQQDGQEVRHGVQDLDRGDFHDAIDGLPEREDVE